MLIPESIYEVEDFDRLVGRMGDEQKALSAASAV